MQLEPGGILGAERPRDEPPGQPKASIAPKPNAGLAAESSPEKVDTASRHESLILFRRVVVNARV
jgi:hypothetical protein